MVGCGGKLDISFTAVGVLNFGTTTNSSAGDWNNEDLLLFAGEFGAGDLSADIRLNLLCCFFFFVFALNHTEVL